MNLHTLEYILAVKKHGHFAEAARECHVSQPTLSMQIKKFEDYYGIQLFERDQKNFQVTRDGEKIISHIRETLAAYQEMEKTAAVLKNADGGSLYLGAFPTLAPFYIPQIMPLINRHFPSLKLFLVEDRSPDLLEKLKNGELDAAFLALPLEDGKNLHATTLFEEKLLAAVPAQSAFADSSALALQDFKEEPLLLLEDSHCLSGQALEACTWAGIKNRHDFRATSIETLRQMVGNGMGITLLPEMACQNRSDSVRYIPLKDKNAKRTIALIRRKTTPYKNLLDKMAAVLKNT